MSPAPIHLKPASHPLTSHGRCKGSWATGGPSGGRLHSGGRQSRCLVVWGSIHITRRAAKVPKQGTGALPTWPKPWSRSLSPNRPPQHAEQLRVTSSSALDPRPAVPHEPAVLGARPHANPALPVDTQQPTMRFFVMVSKAQHGSRCRCAVLWLGRSRLRPPPPPLIRAASVCHPPTRRLSGVPVGAWSRSLEWSPPCQRRARAWWAGCGARCAAALLQRAERRWQPARRRCRQRPRWLDQQICTARKLNVTTVSADLPDLGIPCLTPLCHPLCILQLASLDVMIHVSLTSRIGRLMPIIIGASSAWE